MQLSIQSKETLTLLLCEALHRNLRPYGYDRLDVLAGYHPGPAALLQVHPLLLPIQLFPCGFLFLVQHLRILISAFPDRRLTLCQQLLILLLQLLDWGTRMEIAKLMARARLVDQIDRLIRQEPIINVTHRKLHGCLQRLI